MARADRVFLDRPRPAQQARREEQNRAQQTKNSVQRDADDSKWQADEPHKRKGDQRKQSERPAKHKQDAPQ